MNTEKKQWIAPQATEIEVNSGTHTLHSETFAGNDGVNAS